jgi:hypothetical protein
MKTVIGLYMTIADAHKVVRELINNGIDHHNISLIARDTQGGYGHHPSEGEGQTESEVTGAAVGGAIGGVAGLLLGLGALAIPGLGPVIAAGPLVAGLVGAGIGAAGGGLLGALTKAGIPEEEARFYVEGVRRGDILVAVKVFNDQVSRVVNVMEHYNPVDIEQRVAPWTGEGEEVVEMPTADLAGDTDFDTFVDVDGEDYRFYETTFRRHFMTNFATEGNRYREYEPAYRYGYYLAAHDRYRDRGWDEIESEAQHYWQDNYQGNWEAFREAVRYGWEEVQQSLGESTAAYGTVHHAWEEGEHRPD